MNPVNTFWRRLRFLFTGSGRAHDLQDEMRFHMEMKAQEHVAAGMSMQDADLAARRDFGNALRLREDARDAWGWRWLDTLIQDLRYGVRMMRNNPGFTAVAVLTLALGIGANASIFSIINAVLVRPLPYQEPSRIVTVDETESVHETMWSSGISVADYLDLRQGNHTLEEFGIFDIGNFALTGMGEARRIQSCDVTASVFHALGTQPLLGRWFTADDEAVGKNQQAIISYGLWQRGFGGRDPLGSTITLDTKPYTVIGVMPPRFEFPVKEEEVEVWTPLAFDNEALKARGAHFYHGVGRLKPGVTPQQAKADLEVVTKRLKQQFGKQALEAMDVQPLKESLVAPIRSSLLMAGGAVMCVLLIAGANLAGLLLARATSRQRELSVRLALGASRPRLVRQLLTESVMLGTMGGALGLVVSVWATRLLLAVKPADLPLVGRVSIDVNVVLFTVAASVLTGLVFGFAPALQASKASVSDALKEAGAKATSSRSHVSLRRVLVGAEVALSLVLLCGAGLMIRTLLKLRAIDPGFNAQSVLTAELLLPKSKYGTDVAQREFARNVLERLKAQPGIVTASATSNLPMGGGMVMLMELPGGKRYPLYFHSVTPDFFSTMNMALVRGRNFTDADAPTAEPVAILSESAARDLFPGVDPIGKTVKNGFSKDAPRVVGLVRDIRGAALAGRKLPEMYLPFQQKPWPFLRIAVRGRGNPNALAAAISQQVHAIDKDQPVDKVRTMDAVVGESISTQRFYMLLLGTFAAVAVGLALVGVYGVVSFETTQRTHEIGIRMALGARQAQIFKMIVGQGVAPAVVGLVFGVAGAFAATRLLKSLLYGVTVRDPITFVLVPVVLVAAAAVATLVPARRAVKVDPMVALRYE